MSNNDGGADGDDGENNDDDDDDDEEEELPQHRPQTATTHVSTKVMCNSKFMELSGTLLSSVLHIMMFRTPFPRKERREKKGDKHRNPSRNQEEPANHDGTEPLS